MTGYEQILRMPAGYRGTVADFAEATSLSAGHIGRVLNWMFEQQPPMVKLVGEGPVVWELLRQPDDEKTDAQEMGSGETATTYPDPRTVLTPKHRVDNLKVMFDGRADSFSVARMTWDGEDSLGMRWNGGPVHGPIGNPQSRGHATWFIVPDELRPAIETFLAEQKSALQVGYEAMARDEAAEADATAWADGLIGDAKGSAHEAW